MTTKRFAEKLALRPYIVVRGPADAEEVLCEDDGKKTTWSTRRYLALRMTEVRAAAVAARVQGRFKKSEVA